MLLTREQLEPLVPHAEAMLMIDGVTAYDDQRLCCVSLRHQAADNPLRRDGRLSAHHGIEFAAQAAAVHGGLIDQDNRAPLRALAAVRKASFSRPWLDDLADRLEINADLIMVDRQAAVYQASLSHQGEIIASMRLTLMTIASEMTITDEMSAGLGMSSS
ncbi:MAG: hypothetical protein ACR2QF_11410 [Geminicoccaceae bacterium]